MPSTPSCSPRAVAELGGWEHFAHDADIGVRGRGESPAAAFEQAALALTAVVAEPREVDPRQAVAIQCEAGELDLLFVEWLNAVVFEMATRGMIFSRFAVAIAGHRLYGTAWGESIDAAKHQPAAEVKGATYTQLRVAQEADGTWVAECVVDV